VILFATSAVFTPLVNAIICIAFSLLYAFSIIRGLKPHNSMIVNFLSITLGSMCINPLTGYPLSTILTAPLLLNIDNDLKNLAPQWLEENSGKELATTAFKSLEISSIATLLLSIIINSHTLMLSSALILISVLLMTVHSMMRLKIPAVEVKRKTVRVLVGDEKTIPISIHSKTLMTIYGKLEEEHDWMKIHPKYIKLNQNAQAKITIKIKPPLAAPVNPKLKIVWTDTRGLIFKYQDVTPIDLHIIPKAKYAEWLARRFLEGELPETESTIALSEIKVVTHQRRGIEFYKNRPYSPGDPLKNIDWKKSIKLRELITKQFAGIGESAVMMIICLTAQNEEEADQLSYNMVASALTLATEAIPTGLVAYNNKEVLITLKPGNPIDVLKKTLDLTKKITFVHVPERVLDPPDAQNLEKLLQRLEKVESKPFKKVFEILTLEQKSIEAHARLHPAYDALIKVRSLLPPPATLLIISPWSHDAEALSVGLSKICKNYTVLLVPLSQS